MLSARFSFLLIALILAFSAELISQKSSLSVTGTVTEVKVAPNLVPVLIDKNDPWGGYRYERFLQKEPWFEVSVRLQFCDRDKVTLIIPTTGSLSRGTTKILFLELPSQDSAVSAAEGRYREQGIRPDVDPMPAFLKELEKLEPSRYSFAVVEPETCYDSNDVISVKSGYKLKVVTSAGKNQRPIEIAIPEHSQFKIRYSLSVKDSLPVSEAKRRWSHLGKLLTTSDGDFFFETDVIINKLPE